MSGLFASLNLSVKALNAQSQAIETAGRNLANVNNANYARQRVRFGDRGTVQTPMGPEGMGIEALGIQQMRDYLLDQQVSRELGLTAQYTAAQAGLQKAQAALGQSLNRATDTTATGGGAQGVAESLTSFFNAFQSLAAKPTDVGERQTLLQKADILTDGFHLTDSRLAQVQSDMTTQIATDTQSINAMLKTIATLNLEISRFEVSSPGGAVDLRDARQAKLEQLAAKMNFDVRPDVNDLGQIQVYTKDTTGTEVLLVSQALNATFTATTNASGASIITASNIPGAAPTATATVAITSGSIRGAMDTFDTVTKLRDSNDALAAQLVTSANAAYNPLGTGTNFFVATGTAAKTISRTSSITAANLEPSSGPSGDTTIPNAVAAIASKIFSTSNATPDLIDGTLGQHYLKSVTDLGQTLSGINSRLTDQTNIEKLVRGQRDSISGVSLDEEMADLMKYQRAFQGSSRVISIINDLLDSVVRLGT